MRDTTCAYLCCYTTSAVLLSLILVTYFCWYQPYDQLKFGVCSANCNITNISECSTIGQPRTCVTFDVMLTLYETSITNNYTVSTVYDGIYSSLNCSNVISGYPTPTCSYRDDRPPYLLTDSGDPSYRSSQMGKAIFLMVVMGIGAALSLIVGISANISGYLESKKVKTIEIPMISNPVNENA